MAGWGLPGQQKTELSVKTRSEENGRASEVAGGVPVEMGAKSVSFMVRLAPSERPS